MPPKRRTSTPSTGARTQRAQATLSFHKQGPNRITKPGAQRDVKSKKDAAFLDVAPSEPEPELEQLTTAEAAIAEQTASIHAELDPIADGPVKAEDVLGGRAETSDVGATGGKSGSGWLSSEETIARSITDAQIKKYWLAKERERKAPRVHQEDLTMREKLLREWDMSGQYGPCIGIARLKRWKRANMLGLNPPVEVLAVLLKEADKGNHTVQRAHVDELMSSRFIET